MTTAGRGLYDDPAFFAGYRRLRDCGAGINDAIEVPAIRYLRADLDELTLPARCADLVVSSLVLQYVADYSGVVRRVARWLRPGGRFVFSIEHPICMAAELDAGLESTGINEPVPSRAALQSRPHLAEHLRRPPLSVRGARRGHVDPADEEEGGVS